MVDLIYREGSDSDTSSSENESISSGSSSSKALNRSSPRPAVPEGCESEDFSEPDEAIETDRQRTKWDAEQSAPIIPHKILKLRRLLYEAFHCALSIIYETQEHGVSATPVGPGRRPKAKGEDAAVKPDMREPWMRLSRVIVALRAAVSGVKEGDPVSSKCSVCLATIINARIIPLTTNKAYIRDKLARNEAKAIPSFLKAWTKLQEIVDSSHESEDDATSMLSQQEVLVDATDIAAVLVLRLVHYALLRSPTDGLDLSSLGVRSNSLQTVDIGKLCEGLGVGVMEVKKLNLSQNGWKRLPSWNPFPFPAIESLDMSSNPNLTHLPLSFVRLPIRKIHIRGTALENSSAPLISSAVPRLPPATRWPPISRLAPARGAPTLIHILLKLYISLIRPHYPLSTLPDLNLPPHISDLLSGTYACELCGKVHSPPSALTQDGTRRRSGWMDKEVERAWAVEGRSVIRQGNSEVARESWVPTKIARVRGRVCRDCADRYLRPLPEG